MIIIGTAGHIDHGKSAIVKRLTGTDPDRLPEERERGMTIDLGFAFYRTPAEEQIAFVDVPGHERFVKNMIAGAGGIDVVMLVIAADDGWMPQSQEHFQIIRLLGVKRGLLVLNKVDLVEPEWLQLLEDDIRQKTAGSFLAEAPIFRVSAETGYGFEKLVDFLDQLPGSIEKRSDYDKARLFIDRSFIRQGIGGVVTGTLRGGSLAVGQTVSLWPSMISAKIRTLQSQNREVTRVGPGQRTAVSLTGVDRELLIRGGVISGRTDLSFFRDHPVLALSVEVLPESPLPLNDRRRALAVLGTTESEGEICIFDKSEIRPGEQGIVFYRPDQPVYALVGDRCILRLPTPMLTLGGGLVLDHLKRFPRRKELDSYAFLSRRVNMNLPDIILSELEKRHVVSSDALLNEADQDTREVAREVDALVKQEVVGRFHEFLFDRGIMSGAVTHLKDAIEAELAKHPHVRGLTLDQVVALSTFPSDTLATVVQIMVQQGILVRDGDSITLAGRDMTLKGDVKDAFEKIMAKLEADPYAPPALRELASGDKSSKQAIKYILDIGEGHKCGSDFIFLATAWRETVQFIREHIAREGSMKVADLRERFGYTRKFVIPILEETDHLGLTRRQGDVRVAGEKFEDQNAVS